MTMPNDIQADVIDTATAPAGAAAAPQQTATPPAGEQANAAQGQTDTTTEGKADDPGTQQEQAKGESEQDRDEAGRFKPKIQKRIDELTHARYAAEREAARWRSIAESYKAGAAPQAHEYASDDDYEAALRQHQITEAARQATAEQAKEAANRYQQDADSTTDATYNERVREAVTRIPDFVDVVSKAEIQITHEMQAALKGSAHGPDIVYELAKNPAEAQRIASLPAAQMYMALGAMEATAAAKAYGAPSAAPAPVARTTSAPPPAATTDMGAAPPNTDPSKMPMEEYIAWRRGQGAKYI
jgi:hypothetical protein